MKKVKIYKSSSGNTIFTDLDETDGGGGGGDKPKDEAKIVYVYFAQTSKVDMLKHIENKDFMICLYHTEGYNTAFLYPMAAVINYSHHGTEMVEFVNTWTDGETKHITYNASTDSWSEG